MHALLRQTQQLAVKFGKQAARSVVRSIIATAVPIGGTSLANLVGSLFDATSEADLPPMSVADQARVESILAACEGNLSDLGERIADQGEQLDRIRELIESALVRESEVREAFEQIADVANGMEWLQVHLRERKNITLPNLASVIAKNGANIKVLRTLRGNSNPFTSVSFSPDSRMVATGRYDNQVKMWDTSSGTCLSKKIIHYNMVTSVSFSPDGRTLVTAGWDNRAKLWDVSSGTCIATFEGHSSCICSVSFSPDGLTLATGESRQDRQVVGCDEWNVHRDAGGTLGVCLKRVFFTGWPDVSDGDYLRAGDVMEYCE